MCAVKFVEEAWSKVVNSGWSQLLAWNGREKKQKEIKVQFAGIHQVPEWFCYLKREEQERNRRNIEEEEEERRIKWNFD